MYRLIDRFGDHALIIERFCDRKRLARRKSAGRAAYTRRRSDTISGVLRRVLPSYTNTSDIQFPRLTPLATAATSNLNSGYLYDLTASKR